MDGYEFIKRVKQLKADVKVFYMSAYLTDDIHYRIESLVIVDEYIEKLLLMLCMYSWVRATLLCFKSCRPS